MLGSVGGMGENWGTLHFSSFGVKSSTVKISLSVLNFPFPEFSITVCSKVKFLSTNGIQVGPFSEMKNLCLNIGFGQRTVKNFKIYILFKIQNLIWF